MVALGVLVKFVNGAEMCFFEKCGQSDRFSFLLHHHSTRKEMSSGGLSLLQLCIQLPVADNILWLFLVNQMPLGYTVRYL